jgi:hypothetical protein
MILTVGEYDPSDTEAAAGGSVVRRSSDRKGGSMSKYRIFSMLSYGVAALLGAATLYLTAFSAGGHSPHRSTGSM